MCQIRSTVGELLEVRSGQCYSEQVSGLTSVLCQVVHEWEEVMDVTSADPSVTGSPQLFVTKENGAWMTKENGAWMLQR